MQRRTSDPASAVLQSSFRLLRQKPAIWIGGFLGGVLIALQFGMHAPSWAGADTLTALLAFGIAGLAFFFGWLTLAVARQAWVVRRRQLATLVQRTEE